MTGIGQFEHVASRTSVGQYILQGNPGRFRLVRAEIEGGVTINPFGQKADEIAVITNQTLVLVEVESTQKVIEPSLNLMKINTWKYRVMSPNSAPENPEEIKPWVHYTAKVNTTDKMNFLTSF